MSNQSSPRTRAHGLGGQARPRGFVNTPSDVEIGTKMLIKRHGIEWVMDLMGLGRMAVCSIAAGLTVQAQTLAAARDGVSRATAAEDGL